ncbi:GNAT family N-acetyltransferase [Rhodobacterales bacterium HKCCE4037]|nr:GNAT family N-acetyltransferase [Rhodobacterales bacterium HKCCE4037]
MKVTIRQAETADRATIAAASRATWEEHRARQPYSFPENGWDMLLARDHEIAFRDAKGQPVAVSENLYVAEAGTQIVGFILLSWHLRADAPPYHKGAVSDIWVHEDWRGKGIAKELVATAKELADAEDWDELTAQVWEGAPSARLFEEAGFQRRSTIWRYGPDRPARPLEPASETPDRGTDSWWRWAVLAVILACFAVIMISQQ